LSRVLAWFKDVKTVLCMRARFLYNNTLHGGGYLVSPALKTRLTHLLEIIFDTSVQVAASILCPGLFQRTNAIAFDSDTQIDNPLSRALLATWSKLPCYSGTIPRVEIHGFHVIVDLQPGANKRNCQYAVRA
jgi:hypothetical protein